MELIAWKKTKSLDAGYMIRISNSEAISLIASLAKQLETGNANSDRAEFVTKHGSYFSIAVQKEPFLSNPGQILQAGNVMKANKKGKK